jgi:type I restriction enzyme S subunit
VEVKPLRQSSVPAGYKQTEVGVIPEGWQVKPLVSLSTEIGDGIHSTPNYVKSSEFYFVNGNNLVNDRISITDNTMCVSESEYKTLRKNLTDRTLLLSINGTIGNLASYNGEQVVLGKSAAYINVSKSVSRTFISYCLKNRPTLLFFENELTGTTIRNLSLQSLRNTPVPVPPTIEEQHAIAGALSDMDALIGALEQLIAKKRDLKQAAMQQLLTGQKRLPGFHGEWEVKRLGDVLARVANGAVYEPVNSLGVPITRIETISDGTIDYDRVGYAKATTDLAKYKLEQGDILFSHINSVDHIGKVAIFRAETDLYHGMNLLLLRPANAADSQFLFYWLGSQQGRKKSASLAKQAVSQASINTSELKAIEVPLPSLPEQTAIAEVLSDMDAELAALEQRRDKTRALKQGMMQELLTGRTRLVDKRRGDE